MLKEHNKKQLLNIGKNFFYPKNKCPFSERGFEIDDGWFEIIIKAVQKIENIIDNNKDIYIYCEQIKQKFGSLRIYFDTNANDEIYENIIKIINDAENKSKITCEICGDEGRITNSGYIRVLCDEHK